MLKIDGHLCAINKVLWDENTDAMESKHIAYNIIVELKRILY